MKITVVYQYYQGHNAPGHSLVYELTQHLAVDHDVAVVSGEAGYMDRKVNPIPWYRRLLRKEQDGRVRVLRTYTYIEKARHTLGRIFNFVSFALSCPIGLCALRKPDVVLASSPPIMPMFTAALVCKLRRIPFVIEVRDLWPSSAVEMGVLRNRYLIAIMSAMERFLYNQSKTIVALTEGIRDDIVSRGWPAEKVEVVTCGIDFNRLYPDAVARESVRQQQGWEGKTIVMYFGALGVANNIPVIIRAAKRLKNRTDIQFVLVGDGAKKEETLAEIKAAGLGNIQVLDPVPKDQARHYLSAADICLATLLDIPLFRGAIPTKLLDYMACSKPVICGIKGEAQRIVSLSHAGFSLKPEDDAMLTRHVEYLARSPEERAAIGAAGMAYVRAHFSATLGREKMTQVLLRAPTSPTIKRVKR